MMKKDEYTLLSGRILNQDSAIVKADVTVEVFDEETGNLIGTYVINQEKWKNIQQF